MAGGREDGDKPQVIHTAGKTAPNGCGKRCMYPVGPRPAVLRTAGQRAAAKQEPDQRPTLQQGPTRAAGTRPAIPRLLRVAGRGGRTAAVLQRGAAADTGTGTGTGTRSGAAWEGLSYEQSKSARRKRRPLRWMGKIMRWSCVRRSRDLKRFEMCE